MFLGLEKIVLDRLWFDDYLGLSLYLFFLIFFITFLAQYIFFKSSDDNYLFYYNSVWMYLKMILSLEFTDETDSGGLNCWTGKYNYVLTLFFFVLR